jgi:isopenicillin N synthase-like dioxygenase
MIALFWLSLFKTILVFADKDSLPIIDISLCDDSHAEHVKNTCYSAIDTALTDYGTFVAIGHGIEQSYFEKAFENSKMLFSLNNEEKLNVSMSSFNESFGRGYIPFGLEAGVSSYFEVKEGYSYGYPQQGDSILQSKSNSMESANIWPPQLPILIAAELESIFMLKLKVTKVVLAALIRTQSLDSTQKNFIEALAATEDGKHDTLREIVSGAGDTISLMRLFHYFSAESLDELDAETSNVNQVNKSSTGEGLVTDSRGDKVSIGSSPHTDWGLLTVIMQDNTGGLQFRHNNEWKDVPTVANALVINAGDYLHILSEGRYHSPVHRVLCPPKGKERTSFVFFYYPGFDTTLTFKGSSKVKPSQHSEQKEGVYNTLVQMEADIHGDKISSSHDDSENRVTFGDYILQKWHGVSVDIKS